MEMRSPFPFPIRLFALVLLSLTTFSERSFAEALAAASKTTTTATTATTTKTETGFDTVASQFKAPNDSTPDDVRSEWERQDEELWSYVERHVPTILDHTGSAAFDHHLKGVQAVLRHWGSPPHLTKAGLFHSIYGTEGFQGFALPLSERPVVQNLIGMEAEKLCFLFCMVDRSTVDRTVLEWKPDTGCQSSYQFRARPELGRFVMDVTGEEWLDFVELTLADWMEQVEGASAKASDHESDSARRWRWTRVGHPYAYRREAYRRMSEILVSERGRSTHAHRRLVAERAPAMYRAVMDTEPRNTRHLVQPLTPPQSDAAWNALMALRANGENIPTDFSPRPDDPLTGGNNDDHDDHDEL